METNNSELTKDIYEKPSFSLIEIQAEASILNASGDGDGDVDEELDGNQTGPWS